MKENDNKNTSGQAVDVQVRETIAEETTRPIQSNETNVTTSVLDRPASKSELMSRLRACFELTEKEINSKFDSLYKESKDLAKSLEKLNEWKKTKSEVSTIAAFFTNQKAAEIIDQLAGLFGTTSEQIRKVIDRDGLVRIYSRDQNKAGTLIAEGALFYQDREITTATICQAVAGSELLIKEVSRAARAHHKKEIKIIFDLLNSLDLDALRQVYQFARGL